VSAALNEMQLTRLALNYLLHRDWLLRLLYEFLEARVAAQRIPERMQAEFTVA